MNGYLPSAVRPPEEVTLKSRLKPYVSYFAVFGLMPISAFLFMACYLIGSFSLEANIAIGIMVTLQIISSSIAISIGW